MTAQSLPISCFQKENRLLAIMSLFKRTYNFFTVFLPSIGFLQYFLEYSHSVLNTLTKQQQQLIRIPKNIIILLKIIIIQHYVEYTGCFSHYSLFISVVIYKCNSKCLIVVAFCEYASKPIIIYFTNVINLIKKNYNHPRQKKKKW